MTAMIPNHLYFSSHRNPRLTGIVLAMLGLCVSAAYLSAQPGDTPIVIGDGSLIMESAVPWSSFTGRGSAHAHPQMNRRVTSIDISMPALGHTIYLDHDQVEVEVTYAGSFPIKVTTGPGGRRLVVVTDFAQFRPGPDANRLVHSNGSGVITHVVVRRNGANAFESPASGHTKIVIHYEP
jgi:hypothetical protein